MNNPNTNVVVIEPQRYNFLSKSQHRVGVARVTVSCYWTTKIQFSKQITTHSSYQQESLLVVIEPQRYNFLSKSQLLLAAGFLKQGCYWTTKIQFSKQITTKAEKI